MPVEVEVVPFKVAPSIVLKAESMKAVAVAGLEVDQKRVDPAELRQLVGVLSAGVNGLVVQPAVVTAVRK